MSDAQKLIADVHHYHQWRGEVLGCGCGWNWPEERTYFCGEEDRISKAHSAHVAAEIDKALGGLRKINGHGELLPGGILQSVYAIPGTSTSESKTYAQWISGWTEVTR